MTFIFDNTMYPCKNGTYYPEVELLQTLSATLEPNELFFVALKASLLVIIELLVVLCTWNIVLYRKLRSLKKRLKKLRDRSKERDLFSSLDEMKKSMLSASMQQNALRRAQTTVENEPVEREMTEPGNPPEFYMKSESREYL